MMHHSYTHIVLHDLDGSAGRPDRISRFPGPETAAWTDRRARWD